jgi:hypothetical protein
MDPMVDDIGRALELFLEAGNKFARAILKEDHEAESEEHKQQEPKETAY